MRFTLVIFSLLSAGTAASAQSGVTNTRDGYGNIVRSTQTNGQRNGGQGEVNGFNATTRNSLQNTQPGSNSRGNVK